MIILSAVLFGCSQQEDTEANRISFEVFSLSETGCEWAEQRYSHEDEVIVINSLSELADYVTCAEEGRVPGIDFSQHTLLLARGVRPYDNYAVMESLQQFPGQGYVMNVELKSNLAAVITPWRVAIIVKKIEGSEEVRLHIMQTE